MSKFAKKGALVVDVTPGKKPALAVVGAENTAKGKKILKDAGAVEAPESKSVKVKAPKEAAKAPKEKTDKAPKVERAVRNNALSTMKIKVINKKHEAREGSKRAAWLDALLTSKTVEQAQAKVEGLDAGVVRFAVNAGFIELS